VEITGKVIDATTLEGWSAVNLGDKFGAPDRNECTQRESGQNLVGAHLHFLFTPPSDLNNYNEAITLMDKYPEPFAPAK
jgi:hypothetical protein